MQINIIAIGNKMPKWVNTAYKNYTSRLPKEFSLRLIEIPAKKRFKNANLHQITMRESEALSTNVPADNKVILLDRKGKEISTKEFAIALNIYYETNQDISLLIGGPEGVATNLIHKVDKVWSLSKLTLPHPLTRVLIIEQIYRAWSIITNHPYHR